MDREEMQESYARHVSLVIIRQSPGGNGTLSSDAIVIAEFECKNQSPYSQIVRATMMRATPYD